jgi:hypothetical protein
MTRLRTAALAAAALLLPAQSPAAQDLSRYRGYALESSVATVVAVSGTSRSALRMRHERPARIEDLDWRAPYVPSGRELADPVRDVRFSFCDDRLYQIVVTYDRDRTQGLTNDDLIESFSAAYGLPVLATTPTRLDSPSMSAANGAAVVARWEDDATVATLTRGTDVAQYQFVLVSKALHARALTATDEALALDRLEAPQRVLDQQAKRLSDAGVATQRARVTNKPAFRP